MSYELAKSVLLSLPNAILIIYLILPVIWFIPTCLLYFGLSKKTGSWSKLHFKYFILQTICGTLSFLAVLLFICSLTIWITALDHGMYQYTTDTKSIIESIDSSPVESVLPDDLTNKIILYYRFGCPDCESVYSDLKNGTNGKTGIYWISTRSKQGKALRKKYPTAEVPSGVYIKSDDTCTTLMLYDKSTRKTELDKKNLDILLTMQENLI